MAGIDSTKVADALTGKLKCAQNRSSDHYRYTLIDEDGTTLASTKISHGPKHTIDDNILTQMARQIGLGTKKNLSEFIACTISREEAVKIIRQNQS